MTIESRVEKAELIIKPNGRLDSPSAPEFENGVNEILENAEYYETIVFDLSEVDFISSRGLRVLVGVYRQLEDKKMEVIGANKSVYEVMRLSGLLSLFNVKEA